MPATEFSELGGDAKPRLRRAKRLAVLILTVAALSASPLLWPWRSGPEIAHTTYAVERGSITVQVSATGTLQPLAKIEVSSELPGTVNAVYARENQNVTKGQTLASLETTRISARVEHAGAALKAASAGLGAAQVTLAEAERALARARKLAERGAVTRQDLEAAEAAHDRAASAVATAEAKRAMAEADLRVRRAELAKTIIQSPIDGVILERHVDVGQAITTSLQAPVLFVVADDLSRMELIAHVDEADIGEMKIGQAASFTVDAYPGRSFVAEISEISYAPTTVEGVVTYKARLIVSNDQLLLRPGMTATVAITTRSEDDVLLVPSEAFRYSPPQEQDDIRFSLQDILSGEYRRRGDFRELTPDGEGKRTVYVLRNGGPQATRVQTGVSDGSVTEIRSGLTEGELVITASRRPATGQ